MHFCCLKSHIDYRLIDMGIDGFSTTVFCYGQTGSGKTHTLTGPPYLVSGFVKIFIMKVTTQMEFRRKS